MASYIKLITSNGGEVINLLDPPNSFVLDNEFSFQYSNNQPVWENFLVYVNKTGTTARQWLHTLQKMSRYAQRSSGLPIWPSLYDVTLEIESEGEATAKYAFVLDIAYEIRAQDGHSPLLGNGFFLNLSVLRLPWFEASTPTTVNDWSTAGAPPTIGTFGGGGYYTAINTQEDARIKTLTLTNATGTTPAVKAWIGIRDYNYGITRFQSLFECESGTAGTDTSITADGTASGSSKMQCSFATTTTLAKRVSLPFADAAPVAHMDMCGKYLMLGRTKLGTSTAVRIVTKDGWEGLSLVGDVAGDIYLNSADDTNLTNWNLIEYGYIQVPSIASKDDTWIIDYMKSYSIDIYAERISGSGNLQMDCILLIPADHLAILEDINMYAPASGGGDTRIYTSPSGEISVVSKTSAGKPIHSKGSFTNWLIPGTGYLVMAAQEAAGHTLGRTVDLTISAVSRFPQYRPG